MSTRTALAVGLLAGALLWTGGATYAQTPAQPPDCPKAAAPEKIDGQVVKVDPAQSMLTVRAADGSTHDFHASKETLQDTKVGDKITATLRKPEKCKKG